MKRLDVHLVESCLVPSRTKAQEMIQSGSVEVLINTQFQIIRKPSFKVSSSRHVRLIETKLLRYVARSGLKLEYAMDELGISPNSQKVLDIGLSTGGFAHCLLEHGASEVVGVDVGQGQLNPQLKNNSRLTSFEGINARYLHTELDYRYLNSFSLITVDVSFISLEHIFPEIPYFLAPGGEFLSLVKPQFERDGSHKSAMRWDTYEKVKTKMIGLCESIPLGVESYIESQWPGRSGHKEFFIHGRVKH